MWMWEETRILSLQEIHRCHYFWFDISISHAFANISNKQPYKLSGWIKICFDTKSSGDACRQDNLQEALL
jgi:hypothetical protein